MTDRAASDARAAVFAGSDDYAVLSALYAALGEPQNPSQEAFVRAWELTGFLASDGFEWMFEQEYTGAELEAMLANVGFTDGASFIRRAYDMVPPELWDGARQDQLFEHVRALFEPLKSLLHEYLAAADAELLPALGAFVRRHRADFEGVGEGRRT